MKYTATRCTIFSSPSKSQHSIKLARIPKKISTTFRVHTDRYIYDDSRLLLHNDDGRRSLLLLLLLLLVQLELERGVAAAASSDKFSVAASQALSALYLSADTNHPLEGVIRGRNTL
uniref:Uncharacterized protein n=1 Tax=Trichogramma kaykai TaxID=54128 RepID=A0ABD2X6J7_9HYME